MNSSETDAPAMAVERAPAEAAFVKWYVLALLSLIYVMVSVDRSVISVIVEPIRAEFKLTDTQIGVLSGMAFAIPYGIAILPMGWLVDRLSRKVLLGANLAVWSALTSCGALAGSYANLILVRVGVGAAEAVASPASLSLLADTFPPKQLNTAASIYAAGAAAGQLVVFLLGGWVLLHFGWRDVFLIAGLPGIILAVLLFTTVKEPQRGRFDPPAARSAGAKKGLAAEVVASARAILHNRPLLHAVIAHMIFVSAHMAITVWIVSFFVRIHGLSAHQGAILVGLGLGAMQTLGSVVVGPVADRISKGDAARLALIPALGCSAMALAGVFMAFVPSLPLAIAALALLSVFAGVSLGPSYALLLTLAAPTIRGSSLAFARFVSVVVGGSTFTLITGMVSDAVGGANSMRWAIVVTVLFQLWAAAHYLFARGAVLGVPSARSRLE